MKSKEIAVDNYRNQPFEVVILDYKMPKRDGLQVAKEVLAVNPHQRIIFASAYTRETLDSVKELEQVVELLQKPFSLHTLLDTIQDKHVYEQLKCYRLDTALLEKAELNHEQLVELLNTMKRIGESRTN